MEFRCSGSNSHLVHMEQELEDLQTLVVSIQERMGALESQELVMLELFVHHKQSFQTLHDEVDTLCI
jgi:hypothetical protein